MAVAIEIGMGISQGLRRIDLEQKRVKDEMLLKCRQVSTQIRMEIKTIEDVIDPLNKVVPVACANPTCEITGVVYDANDQKKLLPKDMLRMVPTQSPVIGPCVVCHEYTTAPVKKINR